MWLFFLLLLVPCCCYCCWGVFAAARRRREKEVVAPVAPPALHVHLDVASPHNFTSVVNTQGNEIKVPVHVSLLAFDSAEAKK